MSREWKPGDVAMVDGQVALVWRDDNSPRPTLVYTDRDGDACSVWVEGSNPRPLVVIDPEDREQVERLAAALTKVLIGKRGGGCMRPDTVEAALRSLIAPPKPEEPLGLGAVVESTNGDMWVRLDTSGVWACASDEHKTATLWPQIAAVRVLSEGVTE